MRNYILLILVVLLSMDGAASAVEDNVFEVEAAGQYRMQAGTSIDLAKKMALFTAKRKAVESAGKYLSRKSLIEAYALDKDEIYSLAARQIRAKIIEERRETAGEPPTYRLRIRAQIRASDFVKAEMENAQQVKAEAKESYQEEMERHVPAEIDPGRDIAKAYRLMRQKK